MIAAILSALCYGVASALQARAAAGTRGTTFLRRLPFVAGTLLDVAGFGAQLVALRALPLFVVQAAQAGNLAVTALAAIPLLGVRLRARQWGAVLAVCTGIALLGASSTSEAATGAALSARLLLLVAAVVLAVAGVVAARLRTGAGHLGLGVVAGLGFGLTAVAVRALSEISAGALIRDPAAYAVVVSGASAFLAFAAALQRGAVTTVSALVVIGETALPAVAGLVLWQDRTRPGWAVPAVAGFALAVAGALALAGFAQPATD